ncbi:hypothetical protein QW180_00700 [Vibrio sinaloensis]|nr:hypothetical protein [Vibrio sinaloensis]
MKYIWIIITLLASLWTAAPLHASDSKQVVMLLWRGVTDAEQGFMDYLSAKANVNFCCSRCGSRQEPTGKPHRHS